VHTFPSAQASNSAGSARARSTERRILLALLCLAFLHGLTYVFLIPPWGHYDEPTHFEYGWWIANRLRLPQEGDADRGMRREVAASMLEHGFYRDQEVRPNLLSQPEPIPLGVPEFGHPPLYYVLIALPLRLLRHTDVTFQLYLGRLVSLFLYLTSITIAYGLVGELVQAGHALRWAVPGAMALTPGYADLMTAVNSDAGAVVALSLFLWGAVRTIVRGPTAAHVAWVALSAALCVATKNTAAVAVLLAPPALALAWLRRAPGAPAWASLLAVCALLAALLLTWGDAALWFRYASQRSPTSQRVADAPEGMRALALEFDPGALEPQSSALALQPLPNEDVEALRGITVTLGAWMWATQPASVRTPALNDGTQHIVRTVEVDRTPTYYGLTATIAADARYIQVILHPAPASSAPGSGMSGSDASGSDLSEPTLVVYYDGVVLAEEARPQVNRVRNGSAERTWPYVRPAVDEVFMRYTRRSPTQFLTSLLDWRRTSWAYWYTALILFQSFWARFGWNHVPLAEGWYWGLGGFTLLGMAGAVLGALRLRAAAAGPRRAIWFLLAAGLLVWLNTALRIHPLAVRLFIPAARYAYPAIIPSMLALVAGWTTLAPRRHRRRIMWVLAALFLVIDVVSIWTLWVFHYRR
jgi:hypothetical protein